MAPVSYRLFNQQVEDPAPLFGLHQRIYGSSDSIRRRWGWEFLRHPESGEVKVLVAEDDGAVVGMTARMPATLILEGRIRRAYFATNSMVLPECRGKGIIRGLYQLAARCDAVQLSKGTAPAMYAVLKQMGYAEIVPSDFQVCILSPLKWGVNKLCGRSLFGARESAGQTRGGEFLPVARFDHCTDSLTCCARENRVVKEAAWLNWRYFEIPHRTYQVFVRGTQADPLSVLVLRFEGSTAYLVDILWAESAKDEPATALRFAKSYAGRLGAVKLVFWGTLQALREEARTQGFWRSKETPRFSFNPASPELAAVNWGAVNFVHGDGDIEYL